jgi:hypothetical protein
MVSQKIWGSVFYASIVIVQLEHMDIAHMKEDHSMDLRARAKDHSMGQGVILQEFPELIFSRFLIVTEAATPCPFTLHFRGIYCREGKRWNGPSMQVFWGRYRIDIGWFGLARWSRIENMRREAQS